MTYEEFKNLYGIQLNPQQEKAAQAVDGCTLLLAVPGSGKTTVLVTRLGYMILGCGIPPEAILTMTYTVSATRDMRGRFAALFGDELASQLEFRTINGVSARIIRYYERALGRRAFQLISDEKELSALVSEIYRKVLRDFPTESDIKAMRTMITYVKNQMLSPDEIERIQETLPGFPGIYRTYQETLRTQSLMDFDDQMVYAHQILRRYPEVLHAFQDRYRYLCVDEAQDTSKIQHKIIQLLTKQGGNLFMVGDEDQSIYGFRAAYPEALLQFERVHENASVLLMEQNYRSTNQIVSAADRFIRQNKDRHPKHMKAVRGDGKAVYEISAYRRKDQYPYLVSVARNCKEETAVLYRDNDCALPLIDLLERQRIPYRCRQMDASFFTHRITRDITDIIRLSQNQANRDAFLRVYYKFSAGITKAAAEGAVRHCDGTESLFDLLCSEPSLSEWSRSKCRALKTHLLNMQNESADKAVYRISKFMGYGEYLEKRGADTNRIQILEALGAQEPTPARLLMRLEELQEVLTRKEETEDCRFTLSTIHSSKGLEYDHVILMDVMDGIFPKIGEDVDENEERRMFYVGMTRARDQLSIFTFKSSACPSAFTSSVFPKKEPKSGGGTKAYSKQAQLKSASSVYSTPTASRKISWAAKDFIPQRKVKHKLYGKGTILAREDDLIAIEFADGSRKQFMLSSALQAGALTLLS